MPLFKGYVDEIFGARKFCCNDYLAKGSSPLKISCNISDVARLYSWYMRKMRQSLKRYGTSSAFRKVQTRTYSKSRQRSSWSYGQSNADYTARNVLQPSECYEIRSPNGRVILPPKGTYWRIFQRNSLTKLGYGWVESGLGRDGNSIPRIKKFLRRLSKGIGSSDYLVCR